MKTELSKKQEKKVCIIVPIYNSEKYLGYCLNSIVSQTYRNWNAILVDDGSTDTSLDICRNYEKVDNRFSVFSKENGGVSSARNFGLQHAEGDYLVFLDSDDCLAHDTIEKQVMYAEEYHSPLVIMDIMQVDFSNPSGKKNMLTSAWLKKSPYIMELKEFRDKKMRLIWFTVLLECLHAKLYDLKLWKKLNLEFPEELSLGEDFVVNMNYFDACENVVFVRECGHYYNCITGSDSLTQKYRPDLFENKMYLMTALEEHLGGRNHLIEEEKDAFYCYVASNGIGCVEKMVLDSSIGYEQKKERLKEMLEHSLFSEGLKNAGYIPERFAQCMDFVNGKQYDDIIAYITKGECESKPEEKIYRSGLANRIIRKGLRALRKVSRNGTIQERLIRWEEEIKEMGLKITIRDYFQAHKKPKKLSKREQIAKLDKNIAGCKEEIQQLDKNIAGCKEEIQQLDKNIAGCKEEIQQLDKNIAGCKEEIQQLDKNVAGCKEEIQQLDKNVVGCKEEIQQLDKNINGYIWDSEQRIMRCSLRKEINDLRQRKKAIMIATAEHSNIGDAAITLAEQQILMEQFPDYYQVEISTYEYEKKETYLHAILNSQDIIFIHGGGNIGDLYEIEEKLHRKIISEFPNNQIIIFPQTISFSQTEQGMIELEKSIKVYNGHKNLTLFVRGEKSFAFAQKYFPNARNRLHPDSVHELRSKYNFERSGILVCLRDDMEGKFSEIEKEYIVTTAKCLNPMVNYRNNMHSEDISRELRAFVVHKELIEFAKHQVVITDRLHGMIFSAITGTPCVVLASKNHKISEYYDSFFKDSNAVFFIGDEMGCLERTVKEAMGVLNKQYPIFGKNLDLIDYL